MSKKVMNKSGLEYLWQKIKQYISNVSVNNIYPVGSIYMSVNSVNPSNLFGGTWEQLKDKFLLGAGDTYQAGTTGGEKEHLLTTDELPNIEGSFKMGQYMVSRVSEVRRFENITGVFSGKRKAEKVPHNNTAFSDRVGEAINISGDTNQIDMSFGDNQAHNNMPPYLTVYMWKRTA